MLRAGGLRALPYSGCQVPASLSSALRPGQSVKMPQTLPRRPEHSLRPSPGRLSQPAGQLTSIPLPGPASTTPVRLRPFVPASSPGTALKPEVRASRSGLPRRMRDGTSGASTALRGGSERVGAPEPRALPGRGAEPGDCLASARWSAGCLGEREARLGVSGRPQRR